MVPCDIPRDAARPLNPSTQASHPAFGTGRGAGSDARYPPPPDRPAHNLLERRRTRPDALAQHLAPLDPRGVLARGYSITRNAAGEIVRDARTLSPGDGIRVELHQGSIDPTVNAQND